MSDLTGPRFESQTSYFRNERVTARPTNKTIYRMKNLPCLTGLSIFRDTQIVFPGLQLASCHDLLSISVEKRPDSPVFSVIRATKTEISETFLQLNSITCQNDCHQSFRSNKNYFSYDMSKILIRLTVSVKHKQNKQKSFNWKIFL